MVVLPPRCIGRGIDLLVPTASRHSARSLQPDVGCQAHQKALAVQLGDQILHS